MTDYLLKYRDMFQSTPPRGGRRYGMGVFTVNIGFNPRPRAGGDWSTIVTTMDSGTVSIHAPARGATI